MVFNISVIYGSVRENRQGIKVVKFIIKKLEERGHKVNFLDPMVEKLPLLNKRNKDYQKGEAPLNIQKISEILNNSDGFLLVTGEYNHSIPPALLNILDYFHPEYFFKPSAIACYSMGPFGGVRAAMQLRATTAELGMPSIPTLFPVSAIQNAFDENGNPTKEGEAYNNRIIKFLNEFEWYIDALKAQRMKGLPF